MTQKRTNKKTSRNKAAEEAEFLEFLKEKAKNPPKRILEIQKSITKIMRKLVPDDVSLADELIRDRRKEKS